MVRFADDRCNSCFVLDLQALTIDPKNAYAHYNRGISHDKRGDFNRAVRDFTRAIDLLPSNADFYHNRGFCYRKKGDF